MVGGRATAAAANPAFSVDELLYQLNTTKAKLLVVHYSTFTTGLEAAKLAGLSEDRILVIPDTTGVLRLWDF